MLAQSVAEIVSRHVKLTVEGIDRMYLNVFVPGLQYEQGIVRFFRYHRGRPLPSAALMRPMSRSFVAAVEGFAAKQGIALIQFRKGQRKDDVMAEQLRHFAGEEGALSHRPPLPLRRLGKKTGRFRIIGWSVRSTISLEPGNLRIKLARSSL